MLLHNYTTGSMHLPAYRQHVQALQTYVIALVLMSFSALHPKRGTGASSRCAVHVVDADAAGVSLLSVVGELSGMLVSCRKGFQFSLCLQAQSF